jgi:hypothetical protein
MQCKLSQMEEGRKRPAPVALLHMLELVVVHTLKQESNIDA